MFSRRMFARRRNVQHAVGDGRCGPRIMNTMIAATRSYVRGFNVGRRGTTESARRLPCVRARVFAPGQLERGPHNLQANRSYVASFETRGGKDALRRTGRGSTPTFKGGLAHP